MTASMGSYAEWAQVVIAVGAVVLATFPISRFVTSRFFTIRASCVPIDPASADRSTVWYIELRNKSRLFGGFSIHLFPASQSNNVSEFQQISPNDGGMVVEPEIVDGALEIRIGRFYKQRSLKIMVWFVVPDEPTFEVGSVRLVRKNYNAPGYNTDIVIAKMYQRLMLVMLLFAGVTAMIIIAMIRGVLVYG